MHYGSLLTVSTQSRPTIGVGYPRQTGGRAEVTVTTGDAVPYPNYVFTFLRPNQRIVDREYVYDTLLVADYDGSSYTNPEYIGFETYRQVANKSPKEYRKLCDAIAYAVHHVWFYNKLAAWHMHALLEGKLPDNLQNIKLYWQGISMTETPFR